MLSWKIHLSLLFVVCFASGLTHFRKSALDTHTGTLTYRALPNAPGGYTPQEVQCSSPNPSVRIATNISKDEMNWLQKRQDKRLKAMETFLTRMKIPNFNVTQYFAKTQATSLPNIGISFSGGGYRALLNGAGAFAAFDERTGNSTTPGHLGGLLQSTTYISGLSGGSWLVGSIYTNNFTTVTALLNSNASGVWEFDQSVLSGPTGDAGYFRQLRKTVDGKEEAGFPISITDYWYEITHFTLKIFHMFGNAISHMLTGRLAISPPTKFAWWTLMTHWLGVVGYPTSWWMRARADLPIRGHLSLQQQDFMMEICRCRLSLRLNERPQRRIWVSIADHFY